MNIIPDSNIRVLRGVPLSPTYKHTIRFTTKTAQLEYFATKVKYSYTDFTYIRENQVTIEQSIGDLIDCNYIMFQNAAFNNKWFYAFITDMEYISNDTTRLTYEIDVMQSWQTDIVFGDFLIEREHVSNDSAENWLEPEPIDGGERVVRNLSSPGWTSPGLGAIAIIGPAEGTTDNPYDGSTRADIYSTMTIKYYTTAEQANAYLNGIYSADKANDLLVGAYMVPPGFAVGAPGVLSNTYSISRPGSVDGYTPKNLKVLSALYNKCFVTNGQGSGYTLDYYQFSGNPSFQWVMTVQGGVPEAIFYPVNYAGSSADISHKLSINNFPQCPIDAVSYKDYMARQASRLQVVGSAIGGVVGAVAGAGIGAAAGAAAGGAIASAIGNAVTSFTPQTASAGSPTCATDWSNGTLDFYVGQECIKYAQARDLDNFFEIYGYAINSVKKPNIGTRPHWNYVQARQCNFSGNVPAPVFAQYEQIFNNGITFWANGGEVGNYSLNNH